MLKAKGINVISLPGHGNMDLKRKAILKKYSKN